MEAFLRTMPYLCVFADHAPYPPFWRRNDNRHRSVTSQMQSVCHFPTVTLRDPRETKILNLQTVFAIVKRTDDHVTAGTLGQRSAVRSRKRLRIRSGKQENSRRYGI